MGEQLASMVQVRAADGDADWAWLAEVWREEWGGETMIARERVLRLADQAGLIAWDGETRVGSATSFPGDPDWELTSINSFLPGRGVGTALLEVVEGAARRSGARRLWLITTNDNLSALRFYQRRGYRLVAVYAGAVDEARKLKPSIPETGMDGIPLHDEIELEKQLA